MSRRFRKGNAFGEEATRPRWLIPACATGVLAVLVVWVVVAPSGGARTGAGTSTATVGGSPTPSGSLDQAVPGAAPSGVTWHLVQTVAVPSSATAGPRRVVDGIPSGFAHTPTGALIAVAQIQTRVFQSNTKAVLLADAAATPGRAKAIQMIDASTVPWAPPRPGSLLQIAGFQFVSYTTPTAVIQMLMGPDPSGDYNVGTATVTWDGHDWQLVMGLNGTESPNIQTVTSTTGFVAWAGV